MITCTHTVQTHLLVLVVDNLPLVIIFFCLRLLNLTCLRVNLDCFYFLEVIEVRDRLPDRFWLFVGKIYFEVSWTPPPPKKNYLTWKSVIWNLCLPNLHNKFTLGKNIHWRNMFWEIKSYFGQNCFNNLNKSGSK